MAEIYAPEEHEDVVRDPSIRMSSPDSSTKPDRAHFWADMFNALYQGEGYRIHTPARHVLIQDPETVGRKKANRLWRERDLKKTTLSSDPQVEGRVVVAKVMPGYMFKSFISKSRRRGVVVPCLEIEDVTLIEPEIDRRQPLTLVENQAVVIQMEESEGEIWLRQDPLWQEGQAAA